MATATLTSETVAGTATITATADSKYDTTTVEFIPGNLDHFAFDPIGDQTAGLSFDITITAQDADDNAVTAYTGLNTLDDSTGTISPTSTGNFADGVWTGNVAITKAANGVTITATGGGKSGATTGFDVGPASPFTVTLTASPTAISADGSSTSTITATVSDQYDNKVANGTMVTFTTDLGSLGSSTVTKTTTSGVARATLTSGTTPGVATITAASNSASEWTRVTFCHQGLDPTSVATQVVNNDGTVDNKAGANTEVIITAPDTCTTTVVSGLYTNNPGGAPSFTAFAGGYIDVQVLSAASASQIEIRLYYSKDTADEHLLRLYWWDGTCWQECSDQGVNVADVDGYGGHIWARVRGDTVPALGDLAGTPFAGGLPPRPVGGVIAPVSKLELLAPWISLAWLVLVAVSALALKLREI